MRTALVTEYRKFVSTRLWWILLLVMAVYMAVAAGGLAFALSWGSDQVGSGAPEVVGNDLATMAYTVSASFGYVFPLIVGTIAMTGEFRSQTITPTLLAEPRRSIFLGAKLVSGLGVGVFFGIAGTLAGLLGAVPVLALRGEPLFLDDPDVLRAIAMTAVVLALWTLIGVGFGATLTNQVAAVIVVLAFTQFVEPIARLLLAIWEPTRGIAAYFPSAAGEAAVGAGASFFGGAGSGGTGLLPLWGGLLVLVGYGLVFAFIGRFTTLRRDIT